MEKKLNINQQSYFLISTPKRILFEDDDVCLAVIINKKRYFLLQDSYEYEIGCKFNYYTNIDNLRETESEDIGYEFFLFESDLEKDIMSRDIHEFDYYASFYNSTIAVLFYKQAGKIFCQITKTKIGKRYRTILKEELTKEVFEEWRAILQAK